MNKLEVKNNYIDISKNSLSNSELNKQIEKVYLSPAREWVNKIILIRNYKLIKIYKRKRSTPSQMAKDQPHK